MNKKIFAVICFMISLPSLACNWDRQDCSNEILAEANPKLDYLMQQPGFKEKHFEHIQNESGRTDRNVRNCKNYRCINQTYNDFAGQITWLYLEYTKQIKSPQAAQSAQKPVTKVKDKWAEQCVYVGKAGVAKFNDGAGAQQAGVVPQYSAYTVSQVNGGQLVGLSTIPDWSKPNGQQYAGKFVGWVKKADLQMQDLRNCN